MASLDGSREKEKRLRAEYLLYVPPRWKVPRYAVADQSKRSLQKDRKSARQIHRLRAELKTLETARSSIYPDPNAALEKYSKHSCKTLCQDNFSTFPREIRDMIYSYLIPITVNLDQLIVNESDWEENNPIPRIEDALPAYFGNSTYFSPEFSRELRENHYRHTYFHFKNTIDAIPCFRLRDVWNVGFMPADSIMSVRVTIACQKYKFAELKYQPNGWGSWPGFDPISYEFLLVKLGFLFGFRQGTKIDVYLEVEQHWLPTSVIEVQWKFDTVVPVILPTLRRLATAGVTVRISLEKDVYQLAVDTGKVTLDNIKEQLEMVRELTSIPELQCTDCVQHRKRSQ
jgi:hypothetical protein